VSSDSLHKVTVLAMVVAAVLAGMGGGYATGAVLSDRESTTATFSAASNFDVGNQPRIDDGEAETATTDASFESAGNSPMSTTTAGNRPTGGSGNHPVGDSNDLSLSTADGSVHADAREVE
jgi:hypothetical protein